HASPRERPLRRIGEDTSRRSRDGNWNSSRHQERIREASLSEALGSKHAAVTTTAGRAIRAGVVAAMGKTIVEAERHAPTDDFGFRHGNQRRVNLEPSTLDAGACRHRSERLEGGDELWTTIRIAGVVQRVHTNYYVARL